MAYQPHGDCGCGEDLAEATEVGIERSARPMIRPTSTSLCRSTMCTYDVCADISASQTLLEGRARDEHGVLKLTLGRSRGVSSRLAAFGNGIGVWLWWT